MRVLFLAPEIAPLTKTGGLGDVCAALPAALTAVAFSLTLAFGFPGSSQRHVPGSKAPAARELVVKSRDLVVKARMCRAAMILKPAFAC